MTGAMAACILTVAAGCCIFLYVVGKQMALAEKNRRSRRQAERRTAERRTDQQSTAWTAVAEPVGSPPARRAEETAHT